VLQEAALPHLTWLWAEFERERQVRSCWRRQYTWEPDGRTAARIVELRFDDTTVTRRDARWATTTLLEYHAWLTEYRCLLAGTPGPRVARAAALVDSLCRQISALVGTSRRGGRSRRRRIHVLQLPRGM
jgi:hypothetical protein